MTHTPPPTDVSHEEIVWIAGPRLIGIMFNWALLGLLTAQVYMYHVQFPRDHPRDKLIVYGLYILDWAQTVSATYDAFQWFVYGWGSIPALFALWSEWLNTPLLSSIVGAVVQIFFGWRIYVLGQRRLIIPTLIVLIALVQLGGGVAVAVFVYQDPSDVARSDALVRSVAVRLGGSALVDTVIACSMTYFLVRARDRSFAYMNTVLTRLVHLTIETGTVTALAALVDLVFFLTQHNGLHAVSGVILGKLYTNTLLVLYNNRAMLARASAGSHVHDTEESDVALRSIRVEDLPPSPGWDGKARPIHKTGSSK